MEQKYENWPGYSYKLPENHAMVSLIYLVLLMIAGTVLFSLLGMLAGAMLYGPGIFGRLGMIMAGEDPSAVNFLKIIQSASSLGMFVFPPLVLAHIERHRTQYFDFKPVRIPLLWMFTVALTLSSSPLLELSGQLNAHMKLPDSLDWLENWMQAKELELEKVTRMLLATDSYTGLLVNLLMIAVIPAIGEEFVFRGIVQKSLTRWTRNAHVAIWITAIVFSAIHVQFYGFLPRMLLGALFGYLLLWSGSIWLPILAHFVNNATVVVYAFVLQQQGKSLDALDEMNTTWYVYAASAVVTVYLLFRFRQVSGKVRTREELGVISDEL